MREQRLVHQRRVANALFHGMAQTPLSHHEPDECARGHHQQRDDLRRQAAVQLHQPVQQAQRAGAGQQQAGPVQARTVARGRSAARCRHRYKAIGHP